MSANLLDRRAVVTTLLADRGDLIVVTGLGAATWDAAAVGDHPLNFYLWGAMGNAAMVGLGIALTQPGRRVLVVTGDGEMLMALGAFATIAAAAPANLAIAVIDNERYGETGGQRTHTGHGVDLAMVASGTGFRTTLTCRTMEEVVAATALLRSTQHPILAVVKVAADDQPLVLPPRDGGFLKHRFRTALLGEAAAAQ